MFHKKCSSLNFIGGTLIEKATKFCEIPPIICSIYCQYLVGFSEYMNFTRTNFPNNKISSYVSKKSANRRTLLKELWLRLVKMASTTTVNGHVTININQMTLNLKWSCIVLYSITAEQSEVTCICISVGTVVDQIFDFCERIESSKCNRSSIETLIKAGAMDCFEVKRSQLSAVTDRALQAGAAMMADKRSKCNVLFLGCFPNLPNNYSHEPKNINKININRIICPIKSCIPGILDVHKRNIWGHYNYLKKELPHIKFNNKLQKLYRIFKESIGI